MATQNTAVNPQDVEMIAAIPQNAAAAAGQKALFTLPMETHGQVVVHHNHPAIDPTVSQGVNRANEYLESIRDTIGAISAQQDEMQSDINCISGEIYDGWNHDDDDGSTDRMIVAVNKAADHVVAEVDESLEDVQKQLLAGQEVIVACVMNVESSLGGVEHSLDDIQRAVEDEAGRGKKSAAAVNGRLSTLEDDVADIKIDVAEIKDTLSTLKDLLQALATGKAPKSAAELTNGHGGGVEADVYLA